MKYLENQGLEAMSNFLTGREMGGCILDGRIEAFSCKRAGDDKKLSKVLEAKLVEDLTMDPPVRKRSTSLGDLSEVSTRRLLIDLISTLNASFPGTKPRQSMSCHFNDLNQIMISLLPPPRPLFSEI